MTEEAKPPFFSVIIPVYNKEPHIARSINSVLSQTFQDFELIIVCDPSTDNSNAEVAKFADPRIRVFHRDEPGPGGYAARNLGIKESKGQWIAFLDADDIYYPDNLYKYVNLINSNPEIALMTSARNAEYKDVTVLDSFSSAQKDSVKKISFKDYLFHCLKDRRAFNTNSIVLKMNDFRDMSFFPDGFAKRSGDLYLWVILMHKARYALWSSHVGSKSFRDVIGVSKIQAPSMSLNITLVEQLFGSIAKDEAKLLKRYANRLIRTAFFEQRKIKGKAEMGLLRAFYWRNDIAFCTFWFFLSLFPSAMLYRLQNIKKRLKEIIK